MREETFKATIRGKQNKESGYVSEEEEEAFVKKLKVGTRRFRGKLGFKCFSCVELVIMLLSVPIDIIMRKGKKQPK